ncbi:hypothetical protein BpHYR1_008306 [Brachionus plicatilis]|uniref:Uncharacterized protein n=1 Tax=Brachionus plicatilis TaxID=10195 RepID=A0A3M7RYY9_BRAPC|nr:hypothetical protein BpHYR1_008306 [Brachionus plicatilis]
MSSLENFTAVFTLYIRSSMDLVGYGTRRNALFFGLESQFALVVRSNDLTLKLLFFLNFAQCGLDLRLVTFKQL